MSSLRAAICGSAACLLGGASCGLGASTLSMSIILGSIILDDSWCVCVATTGFTTTGGGLFISLVRELLAVLASFSFFCSGVKTPKTSSLTLSRGAVLSSLFLTVVSCLGSIGAPANSASTGRDMGSLAHSSSERDIKVL